MEWNGRDFWDALVAMTPPAQIFHSAVGITSPYENDALDMTIMVYCDTQESYILQTLDHITEAMRAAEKTFEIFVVDDASKDGSVAAVRQYIAEHGDLNIVMRANRRKKGLSQNYIDTAFLGAGKYIRLVYADNAEPMETLAELFKTVGEADIIVPYYISTRQEVMEELVFVRAYRYMLNLVTGRRINNYNGEPMHLRYNVMRWHPDTHGAGFHADLLCRLLMLGFTYKQLPCRAEQRRYNPPQEVEWKDAASMLGTVIRLLFWKFSNWMYSR